MTDAVDPDPPSTRPFPALHQRLQAALRRWWVRLRKDPWTDYLENGSSLADLERRVRRWDQSDRNTRP